MFGHTTKQADTAAINWGILAEKLSNNLRTTQLKAQMCGIRIAVHLNKSALIAYFLSFPIVKQTKMPLKMPLVRQSEHELVITIIFCTKASLTFINPKEL